MSEPALAAHRFFRPAGSGAKRPLGSLRFQRPSSERVAQPHWFESWSPLSLARLVITISELLSVCADAPQISTNFVNGIMKRVRRE